jgi:hypothetical protein
MRDRTLENLDFLASERYNDCVKHWDKCRTCTAAGGDLATVQEMCKTGQELVATWEKAEHALSVAQQAQQ